MFDIGFSEIVVFGAIALVVLGPEKLPQAARTAGQWYAKIRRTMTNLQSEIEHELDLAETRKKMQEELAKIRQTEADMKKEMDALKGSLKQFEQAQSQNLSQSHFGDTSHDNHKQVDNTNTNHIIDNKPRENLWFRLSDYDKSKRLPPAPQLPNYQAEKLLFDPSQNASVTLASSTTQVYADNQHRTVSSSQLPED